MNVKNLSILLLSSFVLLSCFTNTKPVEVINIEKPKQSLNIKQLSPIKPKHVEWFVITPENADKVFKELDRSKYDLVLFGLTDDGYENLSLNIAQLRKYLIEQKQIIQAYKLYYEENP